MPSYVAAGEDRCTQEMDFLEGKLGAASLVQCRAVGGEHVAILVGFVLFLVFCFFFKYIFFQWRLPSTYLESYIY